MYKKILILFVLMFIACATTMDDIHDLEDNGDKSIQKLLKIVIKSENIQIRDAAIEALANIGEPAIEPTIMLLNNEYNSGHAATILAKIGDPRAIRPLIENFENSNDKYEEEKFTEALSQFGDSAIEPLGQILINSNINIYKKKLIIQTLGEIGNTNAVSIIEQIINEYSFASIDLHGSAAQSLGMIGGKEAIRCLKNMLEGDIIRKPGAEIIRIKIIDALGTIGGSEAIKISISFLADGSSDVSNAAGDALVRIGIPAIKPLIKSLKGAESIKKTIAKSALERIRRDIGDEEASKYYFEYDLEEAKKENTIYAFEELSEKYKDNPSVSIQAMLLLFKLRNEFSKIQQTIKSVLPQEADLKAELITSADVNKANNELLIRGIKPLEIELPLMMRPEYRSLKEKPRLHITINLFESNNVESDDPNLRINLSSNYELEKYIQNRCINVIKSISDLYVVTAVKNIDISVWHGVREKYADTDLFAFDKPTILYKISIPAEHICQQANFKSLNEEQITKSWQVIYNAVPIIKIKPIWQ